ncbi:MAG: ribosome silencing factor [Opitutaceae bacterium]
MKSKKSPALDVVRACCRALDEKKAADLTVLDVSAQSSITDYLILATATSEPHLRALRVEMEKVLDAAKVRIVGMETAQESGWMVIDAFDFMIHLFLTEPRERYGLERLWRDATEVSFVKLMRATPPPAKSPSRKTKSANQPPPKKKRRAGR